MKDKTFKLCLLLGLISQGGSFAELYNKADILSMLPNVFVDYAFDHILFNLERYLLIILQIPYHETTLNRRWYQGLTHVISDLILLIFLARPCKSVFSFLFSCSYINAKLCLCRKFLAMWNIFNTLRKCVEEYLSIRCFCCFGLDPK